MEYQSISVAMYLLANSLQKVSQTCKDRPQTRNDSHGLARTVLASRLDFCRKARYWWSFGFGVVIIYR